ncbi:hypothetical protein [Tenacibaculum maritimum]|uniref:hypothetical protein n=1 Tax=Tenacibaculum maritimum TaxID=107401 RepID=UPI001E4250E8|nr:hypothetical protein [Tenacibaculum maritimum]MCD9580847.1 hypothetical protein [Tenacibaculum maritimum]MCD9635121.1 hypothetical protein [Tenacibaculum maritimum]
MEFIESLLKEKELLLKRLEYIDATLMRLYRNESPNKVKENYFDINTFPISERNPQKVLWLFQNVFKTGLRSFQIQEAFNQFNGLSSNGKEIKLEGTLRGLKKSSKLVIVKYNQSNKLSFWGLSEWIEGNDFKDEYKPIKFLPNKIENIEVSR